MFTVAKQTDSTHAQTKVAEQKQNLLFCKSAMMLTSYEYPRQLQRRRDFLRMTTKKEGHKQSKVAVGHDDFKQEEGTLRDFLVVVGNGDLTTAWHQLTLLW